MADRISKFAPAIVLASAVVWFLALAGDGVSAYFSPDDVMNLWKYYEKPWWTPLRDIAAFGYYGYRPLGGLWYTTLYAVFGFNPLPFHVFALALLLLNLWLVYRFGTLLTGSRLIGAVATLPLAYHAQAVDLYYSTGTIYEILCFTLFLVAFNWYLRARQDGRNLTWRETAGVLAVWTVSLNAKEMSIGFPVLVALYEAVWHWKAYAGGRETRDQRCWRVLLPSVAIAVLFTGMRIVSPDSLLAHPAYRPSFTVARFFEAWNKYAADILYQTMFRDHGTVAFFVVLIIVALLMRSRVLWFCLAFLLVVNVPATFIPPRSAFVLYMPAIGLAVFLAVVAVSALRRPPLVLAGCALWIWWATPIHRKWKAHFAPNVTTAEQKIRDFEREMKVRYPKLGDGDAVYFVDDPFNADEWTPWFVMRLAYGREIRTYRLKHPDTRTLALEQAKLILDWRDGKPVELARTEAETRLVQSGLFMSPR